jgi:hypothetical protein
MLEGRTLQQAGSAWRDHLNYLLTHTITAKPLVTAVRPRDTAVQIAFRDRGMVSAAVLRTQFGPMSLEVEQLCDAPPAGERSVRLRILSYRYAITASGSQEPIFRWEYVSRISDPDALWSRHHVQGSLPANLGRATVPLNDLHLPTGPVPLAEVLRFCIVDLGVRPLSADWDARLIDSVDHVSAGS